MFASGLIALIMAQAVSPAPAPSQTPVAATVPAPEPSAPTPAPAPVIPKVAQQDPMICERVQELGSLIRAQKVCMLKSEWEAQRHDSRETVERAQQQVSVTPGH